MSGFALPYFAYGSNLDLRQMRERCPQSRHIERAILPGYRLAFEGRSQRWGGSGVATIRPDGADHVPGLLYAMTEDDVRRLDGFERAPQVYARHAVLVVRGDGLQCRAFTYVRQQDSVNPPAKDYFDMIWAGYRHFGLGEEILFRAVRASNATE